MKQVAQAIACEIEGVRRVINRIEVASSARRDLESEGVPRRRRDLGKKNRTGENSVNFPRTSCVPE
jgi:hypothetical protein